MATPAMATPEWILQSFIPYCEPPAVRLFNRGLCFTDCPAYNQEVDIGDERVCLPTATHHVGLMEDSTLSVWTEGVNVSLRLAHPLLPLKYAEDINVSIVVDMKYDWHDLHHKPELGYGITTDWTPNQCDLKWHRHVMINSNWEPDSEETFHGKELRGRFSEGDVQQQFQVQPSSEARLSVSLIFFDGLSEQNDQDAIFLKVNGVQREVYWPMVGRTRQDQEKLIHRQDVCDRWGSFAVPSPHCKGHFYFDAESDDQGHLNVELVGTQGNESSTHFTWAFADFTVELPFIETTLSYADLTTGSCNLGTSVVDDHIERLGSVGVQVIGTWFVDDGSMTAQELYRMRWPVRIRFPVWVAGSYNPLTIWKVKLGFELNETADAFAGTLMLFEQERYLTEKRVARYKEEETVYAQHCLDEPGLNLTLLFRELYLSSDGDPTNLSALEINLTDGVSIDEAGADENCAYFSFKASQTCKSCFLHVFSIARPSDPSAPKRQLLGHQALRGQSHHDESPVLLEIPVPRRLDANGWVRRLDAPPHVHPEVQVSAQGSGVAVQSVEVEFESKSNRQASFAAATIWALMALAFSA